MFRWIIGSSLTFRFLVLAIAGALPVLGTQQLRKMPVDVLPVFAPPEAAIQTGGPGTTPTEPGELTTIPMEDQLRDVPGVEERGTGNSRQISAAHLVRTRTQPGGS